VVVGWETGAGVVVVLEKNEHKEGKRKNMKTGKYKYQLTEESVRREPGWV
jgi:hypothetical protein